MNAPLQSSLLVTVLIHVLGPELRLVSEPAVSNGDFSQANECPFVSVSNI